MKVSRTEPRLVIGFKGDWVNVEIQSGRGVIGWSRKADFVGMKKSFAKMGAQVLYIRIVNQTASNPLGYGITIYKDGKVVSAEKSKKIYTHFKRDHEDLVKEFLDIDAQQFKYRHLRSQGSKSVEDPGFTPYIFIPLEKAHKIDLMKK